MTLSLRSKKKVACGASLQRLSTGFHIEVTAQNLFTTISSKLDLAVSRKIRAARTTQVERQVEKKAYTNDTDS